MKPAPETIHLDNPNDPRGPAAFCRAGNMRFEMAKFRRETDVRKVNCLPCLRIALIRARKS